MEKKDASEKGSSNFLKYVAIGASILYLSLSSGCVSRSKYRNPVINDTAVEQPEGDMYNLVKKVKDGEFDAYVMGNCSNSEKNDEGFYIGFYDKKSEQKINFPAHTRKFNYSDLEGIIHWAYPYDALQLHTSSDYESEKDVVPLWIQKATNRGGEYLLKVERIGTALNLYFEKKSIEEDNIGVREGNGDSGDVEGVGGVGGIGGVAGK